MVINGADTAIAVNDNRFRWILAAGLAGGAAEVLWIGLIAPGLGLSGSTVAADITRTVALAVPHAAVVGLAIHMTLSLLVAVAYATTLWKPMGRIGGPAAVFAGALASLGGVWAFNFKILLPLINPDFVTLMPMSVTLASKLLFGFCLGTVLALGTSESLTGRTV